MAATPAGNRKIARQLKEKYGVDDKGKSLFHARIGSRGGKKSSGYFLDLAMADPELLAKIARKGGSSKRKS